MSNRKLLFSVTIKDCRVETFCSGGPGGQHQNKTQSGVRIIHPPSGVSTESREMKSQNQNKRIAFRRLAEHPVFKAWCRAHALVVQGKETVEEKVDRMMAPENLKTEIRDESGNWREVDPSNLHDEKDET